MKLDIGSGYIRKEGFKRVDIDPNTNPDFLLWAQKLKGIKDNSIDEITVSHTLEHIPPNETFQTLREWWRVLKPRGKLIITVPDVGAAALMWTKEEIPAEIFEKTVLGSNPTATPYMTHLNIFWELKLHRFLEITGFTTIKGKFSRNPIEMEFTAEKPTC